jgi:hypothetical protein
MRTTLVDLVGDIDELAFGLAGARGTDGGGENERACAKVDGATGKSMRYGVPSELPGAGWDARVSNLSLSWSLGTTGRSENVSR